MLWKKNNPSKDARMDDKRADNREEDGEKRANNREEDIEKRTDNREENIEKRINNNRRRNYNRNSKPRARDSKEVKDFRNDRIKKEDKKINFSSKLKVIPLGGLDEIGKNSAVIQYEDEMVIVDLGLAFPDETMPGIDLVIPDFSYVYKNIEKLKAIIITHGHEDHIGAVSHFLRSSPKKNIPIYSSKFTNGILEEKLKEKFRNKRFDLRDVDNRDKIHVGKNISVEFIRITHSIPEAFSVAIHTPEGTVVHTGDYKFDLTPVDGKHADFFKFAELGEKGALLLLSDSTNANKEGHTPSELQVVNSFRDVLHKARGRVICAVFSSHAHRVQEMIKVGHEFGRKTALDGRSMHRAFNVGQDTGSVIVPEDSVIPLSQAPSLPEEKVLIICTGTQGELMSAMSRASRGQHKDIKIEEGDVVVMSANSIPGNEVFIGRVVNALYKKGAKVYRHGQGGLHVSGHGCRGDIALMLNLVRPKFFMPVHGEYQHLIASKSLAVDFGMNPDNVVITKNGDIVSVSKEGIAITGEVESGNVLVDNKNSNSVATNTVKDRNMMAKDGLLVVHVLINMRSRKINGQPDIISKGFGSANIIRDLAKDMVLSFGDKKINDIFEFKKEVKDFFKKEIRRKSSKEPMIIPVVATV